MSWPHSKARRAKMPPPKPDHVRAEEYARELEYLCSKPQWKRPPHINKPADSQSVRDYGPLRPDQKWFRDIDAPLDEWERPS